mmetsp:Transcript_1293/g.5417  ORF Transcript_1293/g.5417 Transcript_1293/m.5417 type:complete len:264 (-) Transcript_1293:642-1433(-)
MRFMCVDAAAASAASLGAFCDSEAPSPGSEVSTSFLDAHTCTLPQLKMAAAAASWNFSAACASNPAAFSVPTASSSASQHFSSPTARKSSGPSVLPASPRCSRNSVANVRSHSSISITSSPRSSSSPGGASARPTFSGVTASGVSDGADATRTISISTGASPPAATGEGLPVLAASRSSACTDVDSALRKSARDVTVTKSPSRSRYFSAKGTFPSSPVRRSANCARTVFTMSLYRDEMGTVTDFLPSSNVQLSTRLTVCCCCC